MPISASPVQQAIGTQVAAAGTITVTLGAITAGNNLIAAMGVDDQSITFASVAGGGVTWRRVKQNTGNATGKTTTEIWTGENSTGVGTTITIGMSATTAEKCANVSEWSGLLTASSDDKTGGTFASSVSPVSGTSGVTSQADELCIGACVMNSVRTPSSGPTNSFSNMTFATVTTVCELLLAYRVVSAAASYTTGWTTATGPWTGAIATFKAAASTSIPFVNMALNVP